MNLSVSKKAIHLEQAHPHAASLRSMLDNLKLVPLAYGSNHFTLQKLPVMIVKGHRETGTSGNATGYLVLAADGMRWQIASPAEGASSMFFDAPHTYEDAIDSVYFLVPKQNHGKHYDSLFVLQASRTYQKSPYDKTKVVFSLQRLLPAPDELGIFGFSAVRSETSQHDYRNSDEAIRRELGFPVPDAEREAEKAEAPLAN